MSALFACTLIIIIIHYYFNLISQFSLKENPRLKPQRYHIIIYFNKFLNVPQYYLQCIHVCHLHTLPPFFHLNVAPSPTPASIPQSTKQLETINIKKKIKKT